MATRDQIIASAATAIFGKPLVTNIYRSVIVEAIVASALSDWEWCSSDYAAYDFRRGESRLEVKQSAVLQTWSAERLSRPAWDIAPRTGFWVDGAKWVPTPGRNADLYVLGLHAVTDDTADHRDPRQWQFFVIPSKALPDTRTIGLSAAKRLVSPVGIDTLASKVEEMSAAAQV